MEWKKIAPWNWFKHEDQASGHPVAIRRRDAGDVFERLRAEMDRLFDEMLSRTAAPAGRGSAPGAGVVLRPSVDISEGKKAYTVRVEVPGVDREDVSLSIEAGALVVRGEKRQESEEDHDQSHCVERSFGAFERILSLPEDADPAEVDARFRRGVLTIRIPKRAASRDEGRRIEIRHD
jgi:HSP20 family protein